MFDMPNDTVWTLEPHTAAKHSILRRYLQAYFPKLSRWHGRVVFIDGFAGPGVYSKGEPGSPIIALDALAEHKHRGSMEDCDFQFLFIESDPKRLEILEGILENRSDGPNVTTSTHQGAFEDFMSEAMDALAGREPAPSFVMVDPFGVKGLPLRLLRRLARFRRTELLVSLMYEPIIRFLDHPNFESHLDDLFGTREWREARGLAADVKKGFLSDLYAGQLRNVGMRYVRLFEMRDAGNRTEYFLAFATQNKEGLRAIKDAMWKVDEAGGLVFSDFTAPSAGQGTLFTAEPNHADLEDLMMARFKGQRAVPIDEINDFVLVETPFRETHGRLVLRDAERAEKIVVTRPSGRRRAYWNVGTAVTFLPPE